MMMDIDAFKLQLTKSEGLRLKPYDDTMGKVSIGVGRNLTDVGISAAEADMLLSNDVYRVIGDLNANMRWWTTLTPARQLVLADMCFNMGIGVLLNFKKMLAAAQAGKYEEAADEMMNSAWATQVGDRARRLEAMMRAG